MAIDEKGLKRLNLILYSLTIGGFLVWLGTATKRKLNHYSTVFYTGRYHHELYG